MTPGRPIATALVAGLALFGATDPVRSQDLVGDLAQAASPQPFSPDDLLFMEVTADGYQLAETMNVYGSRFTTYVIYGEPGQIQINGAAAHLTRPGDLVIIAAYTQLRPEEISSHKATILLVDERNQVKSRKDSPVTQP